MLKGFDTQLLHLFFLCRQGLGSAPIVKVMFMIVVAVVLMVVSRGNPYLIPEDVWFLMPLLLVSIPQKHKTCNKEKKGVPCDGHCAKGAWTFVPIESCDEGRRVLASCSCESLAIANMEGQSEPSSTCSRWGVGIRIDSWMRSDESEELGGGEISYVFFQSMVNWDVRGSKERWTSSRNGLIFLVIHAAIFFAFVFPVNNFTLPKIVVPRTCHLDGNGWITTTIPNEWWNKSPQALEKMGFDQQGQKSNHIGQLNGKICG